MSHRYDARGRPAGHADTSNTVDEDAVSGTGEIRDPVTLPVLGVRGQLRWLWRRLTSMQLALILLLMLAVAAIPGSLLPQRNSDPNGVLQYEQDHPELFAILNAFPVQAFDVYASVWFSAIYLLLFISLIGCVIPRINHHWKAWRGAPPLTPARLERMVGFSQLRMTHPDASVAEGEAFARQAVETAATMLSSERYRVRMHAVTRRGVPEVSVSAERGYLRESGNLLFHVSLLGLLISVAIGSSLTFSGQKVITEGETMINQLIDYDTHVSGRNFTPESLTPFGLRLDTLDVRYVKPEEGLGDATGSVRDYAARVSLIGVDGTRTKQTIRVNHPLRAYGSPVYLVGNGYAPRVTIRNSSGTIVYDDPVPFIPQDNQTMMSLGVIKVADGLTDTQGSRVQLGLRGFFYPTQEKLDTGAYTSSYPDLENPMLTLDVFVGDLGIDEGLSQPVYSLDTDHMRQVTGRAVGEKSLELRPGDTRELPDGFGTITFDGVSRYASFDVSKNPTQGWVLAFALLAVAGLALSLFVPRRRIWVKALPTAEGVTLQYAGLARGDDPTLERAVAQVRENHRKRL